MHSDPFAQSRMKYERPGTTRGGQRQTPPPLEISHPGGANYTIDTRPPWYQSFGVSRERIWQTPWTDARSVVNLDVAL